MFNLSGFFAACPTLHDQTLILDSYLCTIMNKLNHDGLFVLEQPFVKVTLNL
jgi:hypothetical protein